MKIKEQYINFQKGNELRSISDLWGNMRNCMYYSEYSKFDDYAYTCQKNKYYLEYGIEWNDDWVNVFHANHTDINI